MIAVILIGILWLGGTWVLESEWMAVKMEKREINRMADASRKRPYVRPLSSKRNPAAGTAGKARGLWKKYNHIVAPGRRKVNGFLG